MQTTELKEQLAQPSYRLFMDDKAGVDQSRNVAEMVGNNVFVNDDPNRIINAIINMEAYFHHLRIAALEALKQQLIQGYAALTAIRHNENNIKIQVHDGNELFLPAHTAPALNELLAQLEPAAKYDNPRLCLEMIQQTSRLMLVLGMPKLVLRTAKTA